jgi:NAD(P)-dependent dehydrogenase (short-subunit alcohol dehydrogenase family)
VRVHESRVLEPEGTTVHSMHPGWAATPGVTDSLPAFDKVMGPFLRTPEQGADTAVWLALEAPQDLTGKFLRDRNVIPW